ncbi:MAG: hypothetical protein WD995_06235, partial [Gemmatimonadota bacterium]
SRSRSLFASERHDFIGGHRHIASPAEVLDHASAAPTGLCLGDNHDLAMHLELHLGVREGAGSRRGIWSGRLACSSGVSVARPSRRAWLDGDTNPMI